MYVPPAFREDDPAVLRAIMRDARLAHLVTTTENGLISTPLPLFLDADEGEKGTLYGHIARANPQGNMHPIGEALAIFVGPDAYVAPSWYASKQEHGKVVPTWNYVAVHAYGRVEFFDDTERLLRAVSRLTDIHENARPRPWTMADAPEDFIRSQIKGIMGVRIGISRVEGARKLSQNKSLADRHGVAKGLAMSERPMDRAVAGLIPLDD